MLRVLFDVLKVGNVHPVLINNDILLQLLPSLRIPRFDYSRRVVFSLKDILDHHSKADEFAIQHWQGLVGVGVEVLEWRKLLRSERLHSSLECWGSCGTKGSPQFVVELGV